MLAVCCTNVKINPSLLRHTNTHQRISIPFLLSYGSRPVLGLVFGLTQSYSHFTFPNYLHENKIMGNQASQSLSCAGSILNCAYYHRSNDSIHDDEFPENAVRVSSSSSSSSNLDDIFGPQPMLGIQTVTNEAPVVLEKSDPHKAGLWVDEDRSQCDPLPPVNEHDKRPATRDLIRRHRHKITTFKERLSKHPLYDPIKHDDLWLLRYLLSHKTVDQALPAAQNFLQYRKDLKLDDVDLRHAPPSSTCPITAKYFQCMQHDHAMVFCQPDPDRGVVVYVNLAAIDQTKLAAIPDAEWPFWYFLEWMFQTLDSVTRRTGRLTKGVRFIDLEKYSLSQNHRDTVHRNSQNARDCQDHYPQMLASVYLLNAPPFFTMCFRIIKPLLPKRFVEKFDILQPSSSSHDTTTIKLLQHLSLNHIPIKYGGTNPQWWPQLVPNTHNNNNSNNSNNTNIKNSHMKLDEKGWHATMELVKDSSRLIEV